MAIVLFGKTECPICLSVLEEHQDTISFLALFEENHKYYFCSDAAFHVSCFNKWEHSESVLGIYAEYLKYYKNKKPDIPQGMEISEFENTIEYKNFIRKTKILLTKE